MRNFLAALFASLLALPALAQAAEDPPSRVARLSHIEGEVSMAPAGTQEWSEAVLNRPLTSEDRIFVAEGGRAELQVGSATIHLDSSTEFSFVDLDDDAMTMKLTEGHAAIRLVSKREREDIEVNTPNASVVLEHPGEYNIEVDEEGDATIVKTRSGEAQVAGEGASYTVKANEMGVFRGTEDEELQADISKLGPRTAFEDWANERVRDKERSTSSKYVSEGVIGYEDLDRDGYWVNEPEYGYVWTPTYVAAGWAPYRFGRWAWVSPWGWTWIDDARWGFAPFHYGRWAYVRSRWCWVPGPRRVRAVYAPALVAWVGGPSVSVNISLGPGVGWFPLAPHEVYVPGYWHTRRYIQRVNVSNTIIVNNTYIDNAYRGHYRGFNYRFRDRPDAVTLVDREHFVRGRPITGRVVRVSDAELRRWGNDARPPAIAPERESILAGQPRTPRGLSADHVSRQVVTRREPPARVNFDAERRAIEANGGRPVATTALVERNPKERGDFRVPRGRTNDPPRIRELDAPRSGTAARIPDATDIQRRDPAERGRSSPRSVDLGERAAGGSAPSIGAPENPKGGMRPERNSSDWATERAEQRIEQRQREAARAYRSQRSAPTIERTERSYAQPERHVQPRIERSSPPPRVEYSSPQPRIERSAPSAPQPRMERSSPQPRAAAPSRSSGQGSEGRVSSHTRGDRGGRER
jgi:hypothetical protein